MHRGDFSGQSDLRDLQTMCSRLWTPSARFHPGQLAWNRYHAPVDPGRTRPGEAISIWRAGGEVVGFGWAETPDWLELQVDSARPEVAEEVLAWFEDWSEAPEQAVLAMEDDVAMPALEEAGFVVDPQAWFLTHHVLDLANLLPMRDVAGYHLRPVGPTEAEARAACHRAAWSDFGSSPVSGESYASVMRVWPYRHELDWVAVDGSDEMVASALVWLDESTGVGLVEPVGCVPAHRGRGLAAAVTLAALHRLRALGGRLAVVSPRGDDDYPAPRRLYQSLGFRPSARTVTWTRALG